MTLVVAIAAGGVGALARYGLGGIVQRSVQRRWVAIFPWGTLAVNVLGAAALGALLGAETAGSVTGELVFVGASGFLGAFTTFSTWMVETVRLLETPTTRQLLAAAGNLFGMFALGVAAFAGSWWMFAGT